MTITTDETYLRKRFEYYPSFGVSQSWMHDTIRGAIVSHDEGCFSGSTFLVDALHRDARCLNADNLRCATVAGFAIATEAIGYAPKRALADVAALFDRNARACPASARKVLQSGGYMQGFRWAQVSWETTSTRWTPRVELWPSDLVDYDTQRQTFRAHTTDGLIDIKHGDGKWLCNEPMGPLGFRRAIVRAVALDWADRVMGKRHRSQHGAAHGAPVPLASLPADIKTDSNEGKAVQAFIDGVLRGRRGGVMPNGVSVKFLEAGTLAYEIYRQIIDGGAQDAEIAILGSDGMTQNTGGTNAKAHLIDGVRYDLVEDDAQGLDWCLSTGLVAPFLAFNHGDYKISVRHLIPDPEEDARRAAAGAKWQGIGKTVLELRKGGVEVTDELLHIIAREHGVPAEVAEKLKIGELPKMTAPAATAPES